MSSDGSPPGDPIRFVLDGTVREIAGVEPTTTVLEYLRGPLGRRGTKEGCAEGDCGACTVVLAEPAADGAIAYRAVNSCIQFVPTLDGRALITVEDLARDGRLHPVQQAMVDAHGSQCGFCTPGFVMSLFALWHRDRHPDRATVEEALAGNLCRCTGYRPILDAAQAMGGSGPDRFDGEASALHATLSGLARARGLAYRAEGCRFWAPQSKAELFAILADHPDAAILAGGTDFGLFVTKQHRRFAKIVWLGRIEALQRIGRDGDALTIGGTASWTAALPALAALHPDLEAYFKRFASVPIRNVGTVGGNIANASPIGDGPPALLALDAALVLESAAGARTLPLAEFFLGYRKTALKPGEIVAAIRVPALASGTRFAAYKLSKRFDQDISTVAAAFAVAIADGRVRAARLGFGGMAAIPKRAAAAEAALAGQPWTLASVQAAMAALARDFQPLDDWRGTARYRMAAARNLLLRFWHESHGEAATRVNAHG